VGTPSRLTTPVGLNSLNFTLKQNYTIPDALAFDGSNKVFIHNWVCEDDLYDDEHCFYLGKARYDDWNAILWAASSQCFSVPTEDGLHPSDPFLYQRFTNFGAYAKQFPVVFPGEFTTTLPTIEPTSPIEEAEDSSGLSVGAMIGIGVGGAVVLVTGLGIIIKRSGKPAGSKKEDFNPVPRDVSTSFTNSFC